MGKNIQFVLRRDGDASPVVPGTSFVSYPVFMGHSSRRAVMSGPNGKTAERRESPNWNGVGGRCGGVAA